MVEGELVKVVHLYMDRGNVSRAVPQNAHANARLSAAETSVPCVDLVGSRTATHTILVTCTDLIAAVSLPIRSQGKSTGTYILEQSRVPVQYWLGRTKKKSEFLQRVSVSITILVAKGNSRVLDCMRHDWQSATAPDLVTSTVHNLRTLAATSDPDTHDPTAAVDPSWGALVAL